MSNTSHPSAKILNTVRLSTYDVPDLFQICDSGNPDPDPESILDPDPNPDPDPESILDLDLESGNPDPNPDPDPESILDLDLESGNPDSRFQNRFWICFLDQEIQKTVKAQVLYRVLLVLTSFGCEFTRRGSDTFLGGPRSSVVSSICLISDTVTELLPG